MKSICLTVPKQDFCKILNDNNRVSLPEGKKNKVLQQEEEVLQSSTQATTDPHTYKFRNCTERPGVTGGVGMQELWTKLK